MSSRPEALSEGSSEVSPKGGSKTDLSPRPQEAWGLELFRRALPTGGWRLALFMFFAGALGALALPPLYVFPILAVSLGALYVAASEALRAREAAWCGFLYGMGFHTAGLYWLTNAILTRVHEFWWVVPFAAPGVALIIAPLVAVPAVLCRFALPGWRRVLVFSGAWTLADMCRVLIFSGFPWNPLGSALELPGGIGNILIQPASVLGVDGLTLLLVLASLAVWQGRKGVGIVLASCLLFCGWGVWRLGHGRPLPIETPLVVLVQGNVPEDDVLGHVNAIEQFRDYLRMTKHGVERAQALRLAEKKPDRGIVVVWPESAFPAILDEQPDARRAISVASDGAPALIGSLRRENGHWYNSLEAVGPGGKLEAIYDKSRLVPFGEYQPWIIPFNVLPGVLTPGPGLKSWTLPQAGRVGPMVCYEVVFSGSVVARGARPDWLLTISNDAWYGNSAGPRQHLATGRMRAVEEGLPLVFANNRGVSAVFDSFGREKDRTHWGEAEIVVTPVPAPLRPTFFAVTGKWTPGLLAFFAVGIGLFSGLIQTTRRMRGRPSVFVSRS